MKTKLLTLSFLLYSFNASSLCTKLEVLDHKTQQIKASYNIKLADTAKKREKGLMYVKSMPENEGMLFKWKIRDKRSMWMKNTYIALDMIFIDRNKVVGFVENAEPHTLRPRTVNQKVDQILEINAFQISKHNIQINDQIVCRYY